MSAHTVGPWKLDGDGSSVLGWHRDCDGAYFTLARVSVPYGPATMEANARLIAAAPDLLAACIKLVEAEEASLDKFTTKEIGAIESAMHEARTAIKQAKGST